MITDHETVRARRIAATRYGPPYPKSPTNWEGVGEGLGVLAYGLTFIIAWIACMEEYGFLFGFGLGWLPSLMLGAIVGIAVRYLWPFVAIFLTFGIGSAVIGFISEMLA